MDLVHQRVDGVWTPNFDNVLLDSDGEPAGEARRAADCSMHPSDRYAQYCYHMKTMMAKKFFVRGCGAG